MRTIVIGTGRMGRRHIQVVRNLGLELVGVCDQSPEALELAHTEQKVPRELLYKDAHTLLKEARAECVIISTTTPTHCEYTCSAAELGAKFILCEKPMASSLTECDQMLRACESNGTLLAINHHIRFMQHYIHPKALIDTPTLGNLGSIVCPTGNFGIAMNGSHYIEMLRFMTEEYPQTVQAWFSPEKVPNPRGPQFEDAGGSLRVTTKSGKRLYIDCGTDQGHGLQAIYSCRYGQIYVDELMGRMQVTAREEQYRNLPTTRYGMPATFTETRIPPADPVAPTQDVLKALLEKKNFPDGQVGRMTVQALVAAYMSHEKGGIPIPFASAELERNRKFTWA